jgi:cytokinesis protein
MDNLLDKLRAGELDTSLKRSKQERSGVSREKRMQKSESVAILAEDLLKSIQTEEGSPSLPRNSNRIRRNNGKDAILEEFVAS